jgi:CheY-like chemotaxis protein
MRILIFDRDMESRVTLQKMLAPYGECDVAETETNVALMFIKALRTGRRYDVVLLDEGMTQPDIIGMLCLMRDMERCHGYPHGMGSCIVTTRNSPRDLPTECAFSSDILQSLRDDSICKPFTATVFARLLLRFGLRNLMEKRYEADKADRLHKPHRQQWGGNHALV